MMFRIIGTVLTVLALVVLAAQPRQTVAAPGTPPTAKAFTVNKSLSADANLMDTMNRMDRAMKAAPMNGDADRDFVQMMIAHHQGAIDMARVELAFGKDPAVRKAAQGIVTAQTREIAEFRAWLSRHPSKSRPTSKM